MTAVPLAFHCTDESQVHVNGFEMILPSHVVLSEVKKLKYSALYYYVIKIENYL